MKFNQALKLIYLHNSEMSRPDFYSIIYYDKFDGCLKDGNCHNAQLSYADYLANDWYEVKEDRDEY